MCTQYFAKSGSHEITVKELAEEIKKYYPLKITYIPQARVEPKIKNVSSEKMLNDFDIICGVHFGGLPIASYISTTYNKPMIFVRDSVKSYGSKKMIEGEYKKTGLYS